MPTTLHINGNASLVDRDAVAIVGARAASKRGKDLAFAIARDLTKAGWLVISGGALGIDAAAHRGALAAGGETVAVVAGGVSRPYPARNADLFADIVAAGGAVVSPFSDDEPLRRWHFVERNAVIARLARLTLVVEASERSGSRHTTEAAGRLGRVVAACPGSPGAQVLLAQGAAFVETATDVLDALAGCPRVQPRRKTGGDESQTWRELDGSVGRTVEELAALTGLSLRKVTAELTALELEGLARAAPGGTYLRGSL